MPLTDMVTDEADNVGEEGLEVDLPASDLTDETIVVAEENPNVADQLGTTSEDGVKPADEKDDEATVQAKYDEFMKANPTARDIHGKRTQKRIAKMTYDIGEADRQREEAIAFAQRTQEELATTKKTQKNQDGAFITEHKARLETQLEAANVSYREAYSLNDAQGMADATQQMARLGNQLDNASQTEVRFKRAQEEPATAPAPAYQPAPTAQAARPAQPTVDVKAQAWADTNEWFGEDEDLTNAALTIHRQLVTQDGYLPQSDAYYGELDNRMRKNYPTNANFKTDEAAAPTLKTPTSVVAPAGNGGGPRPLTAGKIHLTSSEAAVAKRLGVPLKEYAKSLAEYRSRQ